MAVLVAVSALVAGVAEAGESAVQSAPVTLDLKPYKGSLRTIDVTVGDRELPFIFDTGGGLTLVTPAVASAAGCEPFGRVVGFRMSGEQLDAPRCGKLPLRVGGIDRNVETTVYDIMSLLPDDWPELGGIVSLHTFADRKITLDLRADNLTIETDASFARTIATMKPLSARLSNEAGGASVDLFVEVAAPKGSLWFELDSGNLDKVLIAPHAVEQLGLKPDSTEATLELVGFEPMTVEYAKREMIYDGLLNADTLKQLVVALDLQTGQAWAKRSSPTEPPPP